MICTTTSVHETNAKDISIKNALKCSQMYHLCTQYCSVVSFIQYQLLADIELTTKSPILTRFMNFSQIKHLIGAVLMTS